MNDPTITRCPHVRDHLREVWQVMMHHPAFDRATGEDEVSALLSLLLNRYIRELQLADADRVRVIRGSMLTLADRLVTLSETPVAHLDAMAQFLADEPHVGLSRQ